MLLRSIHAFLSSSKRLVDEMGGHANCDNNIDVTYLPILMGYRSCYKWYMKALGYDVRTTAMGDFL